MQRKRATDRQLRATLRSLQPLMPHPWSLEGFIEALALGRGRPIELAPAVFEVLDEGLAEGDRTTAMWMDKPDVDLLLWDLRLPALREPSIVHEIAHLVLGHPRMIITSDGQASLPTAGTADQPVRVLLRHDYESVQEQEAEALGTLLMYDIAQRQLRREPSTASLVARQLR